MTIAEILSIETALTGSSTALSKTHLLSDNAMQIHTLFLFLINGVSEEGEHMSECRIVLKASLVERLAG